MKLKKMLFLCVLVSGFSQASVGTIKFEGYISKSPCEVATGSMSYTVKCEGQPTKTEAFKVSDNASVTSDGTATVSVEKINSNDSNILISYK